jgi:hypothetical protein
MFLAIEFFLTAIIVVLAFVFPEAGNRWFSLIEGKLDPLARRRGAAALVTGLFACVLRIALLPVLPIPQPGVHDEFSHLLLADTLAHGRLANPTHPMWVHFETFHVNWHPTYASMYFPGQSVFLAFGQVVLGHPFWGVLLSSSLMCAAICWALQNWVSEKWALLGGFLVALRIGSFSYWANGYWGGAVTALGGALVLGTLPGLRRELTVGGSIVFGIGTALLAITRPYEAIFFLLPIFVVLTIWMLKDRSNSRRAWMSRLVAPAVVILLSTVAGLGCYFSAVTGSPWLTPYKVNIQTYGLLYFPWDRVRDITYRHAVFEDFYRGGAVLGMYQFAHQHPFILLLAKISTIWLFFFGPVLSWPLLALLIIPGKLSPDIRLLLAIIASTFAGVALIIHVGHPHYVAALTAAFYAIILSCMKSLSAWKWRGRPVGLALVRVVPVICLIMFALRVAAPLMHVPVRPSGIRTWCSLDHQNIARARVLEKLQNARGQSLVIVRYSPGHDFINDDWVANGADIDGAKVLWARDMGAQNGELVSYFKSRQVWLLNPDDSRPKLMPYTGTQ